MKKFLMTLIIFMAFTSLAHAGTLESYETAKKQLASLKASFVQKKIFTLFDETEISEGEVYFKRPQQVLWHYQKPSTSDTVMARSNSWTVSPAVKQVQKITVAGGNSSRLFQILGFGELKEKLSDSFEVKELAREDDGLDQLSLIPTEDSLTPFYSEIILKLSPDDHLPRRVILKEKSGDITEVLLSNLHVNITVPDSLFEFKVPEGYQLIDYNN